MKSLKARVEAEFEAIDRILADLPAIPLSAVLSPLERAGVAALLHSFYNGLENILKQVVQGRGLALPEGESWHRDLVNLAVSEQLVREETAQELRSYLAFRHFFVHAYAFDLQLERLVPLVQNARQVYAWLRQDMASHLSPAQEAENPSGSATPESS